MKNKQVLLGSVENHECQKSEVCPTCKGGKKCKDCKGEGDVSCSSCHGNGKCASCKGKGKLKCNKCNGKGANNCTKCGGSGNCHKCKGAGMVTCPTCSGKGGRMQIKDNKGNKGFVNCGTCNGKGKIACPSCTSFFGSKGSGKCSSCKGEGKFKCLNCSGTGTNTCSSCRGSGNCSSCRGTGRITCKTCKGSGDCKTCSARGEIVCRKCAGSGWYQTYRLLATTRYEICWRYMSAHPLSDMLVDVGGDVIFKDTILKQWKDADTIEFDFIQKYRDQNLQELADKPHLLSDIDNLYKDETLHTLQGTLKNAKDKPYSHSIKHEEIPLTTINYTINGVDYELVIAGSGEKSVFYESVPESIVSYNLKWYQKIVNFFIEPRVIKAATIYAVHMSKLSKTPLKINRFLSLLPIFKNLSLKRMRKMYEKLETQDINMPFEQLAIKVKPLFKSNKKHISLIWQCIAIDLRLTPQTEALFTKLCEHFKLTSEHIDLAKSSANKISRLKDDEILEFYFPINKRYVEFSFLATTKKVFKSIYSFLSKTASKIAHFDLNAKQEEWAENNRKRHMRLREERRKSNKEFIESNKKQFKKMFGIK